MFDHPATVWFVLGVVLILAEFAVPGLVLLFFGLGAIATSLLILAGLPSGAWSIAAFSVLSLAFLFGLRKRLGSVFKGKVNTGRIESEDSDFLGMEAEVASGFGKDNPRKGRVSFRGTQWDAHLEGPLLGWDQELGKNDSSAPEILSQGVTVRIVGREGAVLRVEH